MVMTTMRGGRTRRGLWLVCVLAFAGCVVSVENGRSQGLDLGADPIAAGRVAYRTRCASCHGLEARGDGPVGAALRIPPPDLTWLADRNGGVFPRAYVIDVVTGRIPLGAHGTRDMPVWSDRFGASDESGATTAGSLYARRIVESLAAYLESVQRRLSARQLEQ